MRREVREETGLEVVEAHPVARYDVRAADFHGEVQLFAGRVSDGDPTVGIDGEPCAWSAVGADAHPVLLRELRDANATDLSSDAVEDLLARARIRMTRL